MIMDISKYIESFTASLIREYLHRKGLKTTLKTFDLEYPRDSLSVNRTSRLIRGMKMENVIRKNKHRKKPYKSILEVIVHHIKIGRKHIEKKRSAANNHKPPSLLTLSHLKSIHTLLNEKGHNIDFLTLIKLYCGCCSDRSIKRSCLEFRNIKTDNSDACFEKTESFFIDPFQMGRMVICSSGYKEWLGKQNCIKRDENGEPSYEFDDKFYYTQKDPLHYNEKETSTLTEKENILKSSILGEVSSSSPAATDNNISEEKVSGSVSQLDTHSSTVISNIKRTLNANRSTSPSTQSLKPQKKPNTVIDKIQNVEKGLPILPCSPQNDQSTVEEKKNVTQEVIFSTELNVFNEQENNVKELNVILHNNVGNELQSTQNLQTDEISSIKNIILASNKNISNKWLEENFIFSNSSTSYGLMQTKVGCSGILAPINAYIIKELLYNDAKTEVEYLRPSKAQLEKALVNTMTEVLWQTGDSSAKLSLLKNNSREIKSIEDVVDNTETFTYSSKQSLLEAIESNITHFTQATGHGCLLFLISLIKTRGVSNVIGDMNGITSLISTNGYSTQELVNLLLTGRAVSHVFDNYIKLKNATIKGIPKRSDIGLLSMKEYYNCCKVGSYLKTPRFPIWIVHNENQYTVLFSCQKKLVSDWKAERKFILFYYDPLQKQPDEVRILIDTTQQEDGQSNGENSINVSLEHCIRTKWKGANIIWK